MMYKLFDLYAQGANCLFWFLQTLRNIFHTTIIMATWLIIFWLLCMFNSICVNHSVIHSLENASSIDCDNTLMVGWAEQVHVNVVAVVWHVLCFVTFSSLVRVDPCSAGWSLFSLQKLTLFSHSLFNLFVDLSFIILNSERAYYHVPQPTKVQCPETKYWNEKSSFSRSANLAFQGRHACKMKNRGCPWKVFAFPW